jgi:cytochrome c-type biogenesis protein CcmH
MVKFLLFLALACCTLATQAREAELVAQNPELDARMIRITSELRCLVCQNQTIADSHAGLAIDLRNQVMEKLQKGESDQQIIDYMTTRYGDFVLYRPPLKATTAVLWFGPGLLLLGGLGILFVVLRRRSRLPPDAFDPDEAPDPIGNNPAAGTRH